jgi:hypothetical protein
MMIGLLLFFPLSGQGSSNLQILCLGHDLNQLSAR